MGGMSVKFGKQGQQPAGRSGAGGNTSLPTNLQARKPATQPVIGGAGGPQPETPDQRPQFPGFGGPAGVAPAPGFEGRMPQFPQLSRPGDNTATYERHKLVDMSMGHDRLNPQGRGGLEDLIEQRRKAKEGFGGGGGGFGQSRPQIQPPAPGQPTFEGDLGGGGGGPVDLRDLGGEIEKLLGNPSRFSEKAFKRSKKQAMDEIDLLEGRALGDQRASAASRGVFFGTPGSSGEAKVREGAQVARNRSLTDLLQRQADTLGSDRRSAIDQAMGFGREARESQMAKIGAGGAQLEAGQQGVPTLQDMLAQFGGQAPPGIDPALFAMLGQLSQGRA